MVANNIIHLKNEHLSIGVAPSCGGALCYFKYISEGEDLNVLRPALPTAFDKKDANGMSLFPLVPYSNRIRKGKFVYWGIMRKVPKNKSGMSDPIHGDGWVSVWEVAEQKDNSVTLKLVHNKENGGFPFSYESYLTYALDGKTLKITLNVKNIATLPMPCGLGIHPFFVKSADATVEFKAKTVWAHELDAVVNGPYKLPEKWSFSPAKKLENAEFDTCFGGFDGEAAVSYPKTGLSIRMKAEPDFGHIVLFAPRNKSFFALEPVTNANDAFNLATASVIGTGIKSLGPGEVLEETVELSVDKLSA